VSPLAIAMPTTERLQDRAPDQCSASTAEIRKVSEYIHKKGFSIEKVFEKGFSIEKVFEKGFSIEKVLRKFISFSRF
jgi:hypothetical protein